MWKIGFSLVTNVLLQIVANNVVVHYDVGSWRAILLSRRDV